MTMVIVKLTYKFCHHHFPNNHALLHYSCSAKQIWENIWNKSGWIAMCWKIKHAHIEYLCILRYTFSFILALLQYINIASHNHLFSKIFTKRKNCIIVAFQIIFQQAIDPVWMMWKKFNMKLKIDYGWYWKYIM